MGTNPLKCFGTQSNEMYVFQNFSNGFHFVITRVRPLCCLNRWWNFSRTQRQPSWAVGTELWIFHILSNHNYEFRHRASLMLKWRNDTKKTILHWTKMLYAPPRDKNIPTYKYYRSSTKNPIKTRSTGSWNYSGGEGECRDPRSSVLTRRDASRAHSAAWQMPPRPRDVSVLWRDEYKHCSVPKLRLLACQEKSAPTLLGTNYCSVSFL